MSSKINNKRYFIRTFGCQMNKNDSELMELSLSGSGFVKTDDPDKAEILIFNTCSVRLHAEERAVSNIRSARKKDQHYNRTIVLTGCMAQRIGKDLLEKKIVDLIIGPFQSPDIGKIICQFLDCKDENIYLSQSEKDFVTRINPALALSKSDSSWHQYVTITHGCDNFCAYCIVPYVRGHLISLSSSVIIDYIKQLASKGIMEITLLGQNVNQYGMDSGDIPFYKLLARAAEIKGICRINFITSHPKDFDENIIHIIKDYKNISRAIHLPLQSGSNRILTLMNRGYDFHKYMSIIEILDRSLDSYSISTDIIVGFPGETVEDFNKTLEAVKSIRFDEAFMYAYSPREGTSAYQLKEIITKEEKLQRLGSLIEIQRDVSRKKLSLRINSAEEMIVERLSKKLNNEVMGKTFLNHPVVTSGDSEDIGKKVKIIISSLKGSTLYGKRIE